MKSGGGWNIGNEESVVQGLGMKGCVLCRAAVRPVSFRCVSRVEW